MANTHNLRFTINGQKSYKGRVALEIRQKGTNKRAYIPVKNLLNPDLSHWDHKDGLFKGLDETTAKNNLILGVLYNRVEALRDNELLQFNTPQELKDAYNNGVTIQAKKNITFGELVNMIVSKEEKRKSTNYQVYKTLYNKLTKKDAPIYNGIRISDTPVIEITDEHFKAFSNWLLNEHPDYGYKNLMTNFKSSLNSAGDMLNIETHRLTYSFAKHIKKKDNTKGLNAEQKIKAATNDIVTLSPEEIELFENFDLSTIAPPQKEFKRNLQIYFDTVLLMYYTMSRPADIIRMKYNESYNPKTKQITYKPYKLRNRNAQAVVMTLNDKAVKIIEKYKGQSEYGYIMPLPINRIDWNKEGYEKWEKKRKRTLEAINRTLKKINKELCFNVPKFTMYVFRHSSITNALNKGLRVSTVARWAGTSIKMIEEHYLNRVINENNPL